jgi:TorA maturation chaperone TorD
MPAEPASPRVLAHFWLSEVRSADIDALAALPDLAATLPDTNPAALTDLAVEYQRITGFSLPPYESVFVDPSAMLMAPATARVEALYRAAGWAPPAGARIGAADHLGAELLALADWKDAGGRESRYTSFASQLHTQHLALWVPVWVEALADVRPHPFYARMGELTLALVLGTLPEAGLPVGIDPFPDLPPPPVYRASDDGTGRAESGHPGEHDRPDPGSTGESNAAGPNAAGSNAVESSDTSLRAVLRHLLTPRDAGLYLTRDAIAAIGRTIDLPIALGERRFALDALFRAAGQYDRVPVLLAALGERVDRADSTFTAWADVYPLWQAHGGAWRMRLARTRALLTDLGDVAATVDAG